MSDNKFSKDQQTREK